MARPNGIPGPHGFRLMGSLREVRRDRLSFVIDSMGRYGDLVRFRMGLSTIFLINAPTLVRHVLQDNCENYVKGLGLSHARRFLGRGLLTSEGELWKRQRALIQPFFERGALGALE